MITHHHGDHYDPKALKTVLDDQNLLVCHHDVAGWIDSRGLRVQPLRLHEPIIFSRRTNDIVAWPVPAVDGLGHPQVSWVIDGGGRRIFHGGDTLWHGHWWDIARTYGPFDVAFLPINAARQILGRYTDSGFPMVLTPEQAVSAGKILGATVICPIHYGSHEPPVYLEIDQPEKRFLDAAKTLGQRVHVAKPGDWLAWTTLTR